MTRWCSMAMLVGLYGGAALAQQPASDSAVRCDSIIAANRVDSVPVGLFFTANRVDAGELVDGQAQTIATAVATEFALPRPFRVGVFDGPAQMRSLRRTQSPTGTELRTPSITGVYRFTSTKIAAVAHVETVRASLVIDLDRAMIAAIHAASIIKEVSELPSGDDSMRVQVRVSTDSALGSRRAITLYFPRMRVVDAVPASDNPLPIVSEAARAAGTEEVLLRFVVSPTGLPDESTVEVARARSGPLLVAALEALLAQQFSPATIGGCAVSQVVYYPFSFAAAPEKTPPRH